MTEKRTVKEGPLSRSSLEAYTGIAVGVMLGVFPVTWWMRILMFLILETVAVDFVMRSPFTIKWWKFVKYALCIAVVMLLGFVAINNVQDAYTLSRVPPPDQYMLSYGSLDPNLLLKFPPLSLTGKPGGLVSAAGYLLGKYAKDYRLVAVCFHYRGTSDFKDVKNISKSAAFDIAPYSMELSIQWNNTYMSELSSGIIGPYYVLLMVPKELSVDSFDSVREAMAKGAIILNAGGQPKGI